MKYLAIVTVALLAGAQVAAVGSTSTCDECKTASETNLEKGNATDKCAALKTYITCLASTTKDAAGCASSVSFVTKLKAFNATTNCTATDALSDVCSCQKKYWDVGGDCSKIDTLALCLTSATGKGCDTKSNATATLDAANKRCGKEPSTPSHPKGGSSTPASNSKDGARAVEASGLATIILFSILGMFFM